MRRALDRAVQRLRDCVVGTYLMWSERGGPQLGAAVAFYSIFALAPLLVVAIAIAGLAFGADAVRGRVVEQLGGLLGATAARGIETMIASAWNPREGVIAGLIAVVTLLVGASGVMVELKRALNAMLERSVTPRSLLSSFVRTRLTAFAMVLGVGFLTIMSLLLSTAVSAIAGYLPARFPDLELVLSALDHGVSVVVLTAAFAALVRWLPDHSPPARVVAIAAFASALLFTLGKYLVGLYLARASVVSTYGAAGSLVVLIIWVYYTSQVLLIGVAFGRQFEPHVRAGPPPAPRISAVDSERAGST